MTDCPHCGAQGDEPCRTPSGFELPIRHQARTTKKVPTPTYLGFDIETTGLDPAKHRIIEVAAIVLDEALTEIFAWSTGVQTLQAAIESTNDFVTQMHLASGLFKKLGDGQVVDNPEVGWTPLSTVEHTLTQIAGKFPEKPILLGSSVHFDRGFVRHWMPDFDRLLHHRHFDVSVLKMALKRVWPEPEVDSVPHRALSDARRSIAIARKATEP